MNISQNSFYVPQPLDRNWTTAFAKYVVEAATIEMSSDEDLEEWQKTSDFAETHLKIIKPSDYDYKYIVKSDWIKCPNKTMAHPLNFDEYVALVHELEPERSLPKGWKAVK